MLNVATSLCEACLGVGDGFHCQAMCAAVAGFVEAVAH